MAQTILAKRFPHKKLNLPNPRRLYSSDVKESKAIRFLKFLKSDILTYQNETNHFSL
jgi:hypothetical protein